MNQPGNPAAEASQALRLGRERHGAGAYREAAAYFREALRVRESAFGNSDARTLDAVRHLAAAVAAMGDLDEASELQGRALAGSADLAGRLRTRLADDAAALARLEGRRKEWDSAASLWLVALRERRAALGPDHADTLHALAQLATSFQSAGKVRRAERAWRRLLAAREAAGAPAADIAAVRERIADCLAAQEQRGEALAMRLRAMGERDPGVSPTPPDATRTARIPAQVAGAAAGRAAAGTPGGSGEARGGAPERSLNAAGASGGSNMAWTRGPEDRESQGNMESRGGGADGGHGAIRPESSGAAQILARLGSLRDVASSMLDRSTHGYRRIVFAAVLLVVLLCAFVVVRYEMSRDGAVPEESVEWYMEPPSQLGSPSTEVYTPD